jgi:hypothetical protein
LSSADKPKSWFSVSILGKKTQNIVKFSTHGEGHFAAFS